MHLQRQPTLELFSKEEPAIPEDNILNPIYSSLEQQGWPQKDTSTGSRHPEDSSERDSVHQVKGAVSQPMQPD